MAYEPKPVTT